MAEPTEAAQAETKKMIVAPPGLEGVAVAETSIGDVRGEEGFYHYRGYNAAELARQLSFEQVWHLLIEGSLPDKAQTDEFRRRTAGLRTLPEKVAKLLPEIAAGESFVPLNALRTAVSLTASVLGLEPVMDIKAEKVREQALRMTAMVPGLLMGLYRAHQGKPVVQPDPDLGYAAAFLQMLTGKRPDEAHARAVEKYLILTMDHGFNASTFTARVIASTGADVAAALSGAVGAMSGPLHGGAPARVLHMIEEVEKTGDAQAYVKQALDSGDRLMGFGHRVYRAEDPRARVLRHTAKELGAPRYEVAAALETAALAELHARRPDRVLATNVEFWAAIMLDFAEVPSHMFTSMFACARTAGWAAHILEQKQTGRLVRPSARYVGPVARPVSDVPGAAEVLDQDV
jgi:citrate synthase